MSRKPKQDIGYFDLNKFYDEKGNLRDPLPQTAMDDLEKLITVVLNKHFSKVSPSKKDDLKQLGWYKVFKTLRAGGFDPSRSSLKNYLYTGIRNEMGNFLVKGSREEFLDNTLLEGGFLQEYDEDGAPVGQDDNPYDRESSGVQYEEFVLKRRDIEDVVSKFTRVEHVWDRLGVYFRGFGYSTDFGHQVSSDDDEEGGEIAAIAALVVWHYRRTH